MGKPNSNHVSLETAKMLRKAGFDLEVDCSYDLASYDDHGRHGKFMRSGTSKKWNYNSHEFTISAPTLDEAVEWLLSVHHIQVDGVFGDIEYTEGIGGLVPERQRWNAKVSELDKPKAEQFGLVWDVFYSKNSALDSAILKACQIITNDFEINLDD